MLLHAVATRLAREPSPYLVTGVACLGSTVIPQHMQHMQHMQHGLLKVSSYSPSLRDSATWPSSRRLSSASAVKAHVPFPPSHAHKSHAGARIPRKPKLPLLLGSAVLFSGIGGVELSSEKCVRPAFGKEYQPCQAPRAHPVRPHAPWLRM